MSGRILIVEPSAPRRIALRTALCAACHDAVAVSDLPAARRAARRTRPQVVIGGADPTPGAAAQVAAALSAPAFGGAPVLVLTSEAPVALRRAALAAGAAESMAWTAERQLLMARLRALLRLGADVEAEARRTGAHAALGLAEPMLPPLRPGRVAVVGDDAAAAAALAAQLRPHLGAAVVGVQTRAALERGGFAAYLALPDPGRGAAVLAELRARPATRDAALVATTPPGDEAGLGLALDLGADDAMAEPLDLPELTLRLTAQLARKSRRDRLREAGRRDLQLAVVDALTGLPNRAHALPHLERIAARGRSWAVALLDLDRFKAVNDRHGHAAGDAVLAEAARRLRVGVRTGDLLSRHGGEEFLLTMPGADVGAARAAAQRLCTALSATPIGLPGGARLHVTASAGVATGREGADAVARTLAAADRALYAAKAEGRDRVRCAAA